MEKYFPKDVRNKKEMEFLELKQGTWLWLNTQPSLRSWRDTFPIIKEEMAKNQNVWSFWTACDLRWSKLWITKVFVSFYFWWTCAGFGMKTPKTGWPIIGVQAQWKTKRMELHIGENHTRPLLSNMVIALTIRGLLLRAIAIIINNNIISYQYYHKHQHSFVSVIINIIFNNSIILYQHYQVIS